VLDFIRHLLYNISMLTSKDIERIFKPKEIKRIDNARRACRNSTTDWAKNYWFNVFEKLCKKYGHMDTFRGDRGDIH